MKLLTKKIYSNYPIEDDTTIKFLTFNNLDFTDKTKLVPLDDSLILLDENYLYIDGTSSHEVKKVHGGKSVWIVLARQFWWSCINLLLSMKVWFEIIFVS